MSVVSQNIRLLIAKNGWKKKKVAEWMGIHQNSLSRKLSGEVQFTLPNIVNLHERTGVSYNEILDSGNQN